jgi:hypothetical protein
MSVPPTQAIATWLAKIGLERYAAAFAVNDIDISVLAVEGVKPKVFRIRFARSAISLAEPAPALRTVLNWFGDSHPRSSSASSATAGAGARLAIHPTWRGRTKHLPLPLLCARRSFPR